MKDFYDLMKMEQLLSANALPELLTKDFESEQIWQQIELQNEAFSDKSISNVSKALVNKEQLLFGNVLVDEDFIKNSITEHQNEDSGDSNNSSDEEYELEQKDAHKTLFESDHELSSDEDINDDEKIGNRSNSFKKSIVDDEFFKLDEMETFLRAEDSKVEDKSGDIDSDSDDGSIDLFKSDSDKEDDDVKKAKFKDFFVSKPEDKPLKRNKFLKDLESDDGDDNDDVIKSTFELRQERLQQKITELEENAISEKPWTLKGEIAADSRPQNSLLEEILEFDLTSKPGKSILTKTSCENHYFCSSYFVTLPSIFNTFYCHIPCYYFK